MVVDPVLWNQHIRFACRVRGYPQWLTVRVNSETASKWQCFLQYGHPRWACRVCLSQL